MFPDNPCNVSNLPKPDLFHTMQIGMLDHLQKWIVHFMTTHKQLVKDNATWLFVPPYHERTLINKSYEEVSQWNGNQMKEMGQYLVGVETQSLRGGRPAQRPIFNHANECTQALLEFYMYACYKCHNDATLSHMEDALRHSHTFTDVFVLGCADKQRKAKANSLRTELTKKRKVNQKTNAATLTPSKMWPETMTSRDHISHEIAISKELEADFNFPQIHFISHLVEQIRRYGALQQ